MLNHNIILSKHKTWLMKKSRLLFLNHFYCVPRIICNCSIFHQFHYNDYLCENSRLINLLCSSYYLWLQKYHKRECTKLEMQKIHIDVRNQILHHSDYLFLSVKVIITHIPNMSHYSQKSQRCSPHNKQKLKIKIK